MSTQHITINDQQTLLTWNGNTYLHSYLWKSAQDLKY